VPFRGFPPPGGVCGLFTPASYQAFGPGGLAGHIRSKIAAMPCPPPMHMMTSAYVPPVRRSS
jgi:hypothetical protein